MEKSKNTIINRIAKLQRLAEAESGKPEGELAASFARKLMLQHAITMAEVDDGTKDEEIATFNVDLGKRQVWRKNLAWSVSKHCECKYVAWHGDSRRGYYVGHESDVEIAKYLFTALVNQIEAEVTRHMKDWCKYEAVRDWHTNRPIGAKSERTEFCISAVSVLNERLRVIRKAEAAASPSGNALVLRRGTAVEAWSDKNLNLGRSRPQRYRHNEAGMAAGNRINISAGIAAENNTKQLR